MKFSAGVVTKTGQIQGRAFENKEEAEAYILEMADKIGIKQGRIRNLNTGEEEVINFEEEKEN